MAVCANACVRIGNKCAVLVIGRPHTLADKFQIYLVADPSARRHSREVLEALGAPFEEVIAFSIALIFELYVLLKCLWVTELVHHHRVVDDEVHWNLRVDLCCVTAQFADRIAHRCQVNHTGNAGKILQQNAGRAVLDLAAGYRVLLPVDYCLRILG